MMKNRHYPIKASDFIKEIEPHILKYYKRPGRPADISHINFFGGVILIKKRLPWRDVPAFYGHWHTIYTRFKRWSENGLFWHLLYLLQKRKKISLNCVWIDSTIVLVHRHGSGSLKKGPQSIGRGRKGISTKIHVGLAGHYLRSVCLSEGQRTDMKVFSTLWAKGDWRQISDVIADKGYDCYDVKKLTHDRGKYPLILRRQGAIYPGIQPKDKEKYKTRNAVERFFGKIKEYIKTRFTF